MNKDSSARSIANLGWMVFVFLNLALDGCKSPRIPGGWGGLWKLLARNSTCYLNGSWWAPANLIGDVRKHWYLHCQLYRPISMTFQQAIMTSQWWCEDLSKNVGPRKIPWCCLCWKKQDYKILLSWVGFFFCPNLSRSIFDGRSQMVHSLFSLWGGATRSIWDELRSFGWSSSDKEFWAPQK